MIDRDGHQPARRAPFREPSTRETLAVLGLAILSQGLEAFVLLAGGLLLPVLFLFASSLAAALLCCWLRSLRFGEGLALLLTAATAAAVPWVTYWLYPLRHFSGVGLLLGLVSPYGIAGVRSTLAGLAATLLPRAAQSSTARRPRNK